MLYIAMTQVCPSHAVYYFRRIFSVELTLPDARARSMRYSLRIQEAEMAPKNMDKQEDFDAGERRALEALSQQYREASEGIVPPDEVRARIMAAAEESVRAAAPRRKAAFPGGWLGLFAVAFSAVLALVLVMDTGMDGGQGGVLSPASTDPAVVRGGGAPDSVSAALPPPPVSKGGACALQVPDAVAGRPAWEDEYRRLADLGCNASLLELQKKFSDTPMGTGGQKLTGMPP
ncbi:MAG: hypothetical protein RBS46_09170 [Methyloversatilis sp.]|nr:hypothetical protein [Methyloversatilis sp.]